MASRDIVLFGRTQIAIQTPFDNSTNGFTAIEVQSAIEEISNSLILLHVPCDASVYVKAAVRMTALGTAVNALADTVANANVIGVVIAKPTVTTCHIQVTGVTPAIFLALDPTKEYYLSDLVAGEITITPPLDPGEALVRVGQPFSAAELLVNKGTIIERT